MKLSTSIVIPTYNGRKLLQKHLPSVVKNTAGSKIIIVDDASTDDTLEWLQQNYPQITCLSLKSNRGFSYAVNAGFKQAQTDLVLLLNNDVTLYPDTLVQLKKQFAQIPNLFAVGAREELPGGGFRGRSWGHFQRGLLIHSKHPRDQAGPTLWVFGASGLFSRQVWHKLGGLDELYAPAYWEDIDIGYRAWKAGYKSWYLPTARVFHQGEATTNRVLGGKKAAIVFRNQLLFFWKNITSLKLIILHLIWTPYHLTFTSWRSQGAFLWGFFWALAKLSQVNKNYKPLRQVLNDQVITQLNETD